MGYWASVHRRALRESLELVRLERPGRAALTLALIAGPSFLIWTYSPGADAFVRALATAATTAFCGLVAYGFKLFSIPPRLARETEAQHSELSAKLASFDTPQDDATMRQGLAYILNRRWDMDIWHRDGALSAAGSAVREIQRLANRERVHVWGQTTQSSVHQIVPPYFWADTSLDILSITSSEDCPIRSDKNTGLTPARWNNLRINRAEFEREWSPHPESHG